MVRRRRTKYKLYRPRQNARSNRTREELAFPVYNPHFQAVPNDREVTLGVTTFYDRQDVYQDEIAKAYLQGWLGRGTMRKDHDEGYHQVHHARCTMGAAAEGGGCGQARTAHREAVRAGGG
jgi:hypothetical protein